MGRRAGATGGAAGGLGSVERTPIVRPVSLSRRRSAISTRSPSDSSADCSSTTSFCPAYRSAAASWSTSRPARTSISWSSGSPTTKRRAAPTATATFIASRTGVAAGVTTSPTRCHRLLHRERARRGARSVVAVQPARDRIAAEGDDVAAHAVELVDDRVEDEIQAGGQLLGAALRPELLGQGLGQLREPGDVGEEGGAADAVGQLDALEERPSPVAGDVGLRVVERQSGAGRRSDHDPNVGHASPGQRAAALPFRL